MREIKFRGYSTKYKKWYYGYLDKPMKNGDWFTIHDENYLGNMLVEEDSIGQYTGFKDKNGTEIYEGDIVKAEDDLDYVVNFDISSGWIGINRDFDKIYSLLVICDEDEADVIDNIYERNKETVKIGF